MEKSHKVMNIRFVGTDIDAVDVDRAKLLVELVKSLSTSGGIFFSKRCARSIDQHDLASLGILNLNDSHRRQFRFGTVAYANTNNIVPFVQQAQRFLEIGLDKIRNDKDGRPFAYYAG